MVKSVRRSNVAKYHFCICDNTVFWFEHLWHCSFIAVFTSWYYSYLLNPYFGDISEKQREQKSYFLPFQQNVELSLHDRSTEGVAASLGGPGQRDVGPSDYVDAQRPHRQPLWSATLRTGHKNKVIKAFSKPLELLKGLRTNVR